MLRVTINNAIVLHPNDVYILRKDNNDKIFLFEFYMNSLESADSWFEDLRIGDNVSLKINKDIYNIILTSLMIDKNLKKIIINGEEKD